MSLPCCFKLSPQSNNCFVILGVAHFERTMCAHCMIALCTKSVQFYSIILVEAQVSKKSLCHGFGRSRKHFKVLFVIRQITSRVAKKDIMLVVFQHSNLY